MHSVCHYQDCIEGMLNTPDKYYDLAIVDPPYGIGEDGRKTKSREGFVKQPNGSKIFLSAKNYVHGNWDNCSPTQQYFDELFRVSKKVIMWGENFMRFTQKENSTGRIIWDKVNGDNDFSDCEIAWTNCISSVRQIEYMWAGFNQGKSFKEGRIMQGNKKLNEPRIHPTQKPIILYRWLLQEYGGGCEKILDTHLGSGSHRIAAYMENKEFTSYENNPVYYKNQEDRFHTFLKQPILF